MTFTPAPGAAPLPRMISAQAGYEVRGLLRNGEQLLLTLVIPIVLLVLFSGTSLVDVGGGRRASWPWPYCRPPSPARRSAPDSSGGTACSSVWAPRHSPAPG